MPALHHGGDFGRTLRDARERCGVSLQQVADATRIPVRMLAALERNDLARLPQGIFSCSFARYYDRQIGLDPDRTVDEFIAHCPDESVATGHGDFDRDADIAEFESERRMAAAFLQLIGISVPLAVLVL